MSEADVFIDDVKLQDEFDLVVTLDSQEPILPSTRDMTISIPNTHGSYDYGAFLDSRVFGLSCMFKRMSYTDLKEQSRKLAKLFVDQFGRPKTVKLRFGDEPDKFYYVRLSGGVPIDRGAGVGKFTLPLVAHDPYAYAEPNAYDPTESQKYDTSLTYNSGLMYPNITTFDWRYRRHYTYIHNYSYYDTPLKILINGYVVNPRVTNMTTGKTITVSGEYNGLLVIDPNHYTVASADEVNNTHFLSPSQPITPGKLNYRNELSRFSGDFLFLQEGTNELLFEGGNPNAVVTLDWYHRYM